MRLRSSEVDVADSLEAIHELYEAHHWTDGLPIIPPSRDRVVAMIAAAGREPDECIAVLAPSNGVATVEKIAINAVMAGCKPEYLPVILTAIEALAERTLVTTNKWGSIQYASPERLQSEGHVNEQADFWSLGVILFEMVAGLDQKARIRKLGAQTRDLRRRAHEAVRAGFDDGEHGADRDRLAFGDTDLGDDAARRRRHLGVHLVGRHLEERLVGPHGVAVLLEPTRET